MNGLILLLQASLVALFALLSLRWGKQGLISFVVLQTLFANLFVLKQIELFSFTVTCSDAFAIGSVLGMNLLQEYFGKEESRKGLHLSFFFSFLFLLLAQIHLLYLPSPFDTKHAIYEVLFAPSLRIIVASFASFYIVQRFDILFFGFLKERFASFPLAGRVFLSLIVAQLLDTVLFSFGALYGIVQSVSDIIQVSFVIKMVVIAIAAPFTTIARYFVKQERT